jgi:hypothetical protein
LKKKINIFTLVSLEMVFGTQTKERKEMALHTCGPIASDF